MEFEINEGTICLKKFFDLNVVCQLKDFLYVIHRYVL